MRILIIHTHYKVKGGEDSVVDNEMELLRLAGHEVELLSYTNSGNALLKLVQLPFNLHSYFKTKRKLGVFKPNVVHIHNLHFAGSSSVIYAVKSSAVPIVVTLHNYRMLCPSATLFFGNAVFTSSINKIFPFEAVKKGVYQNSKLLTFWLAISGTVNQVLKIWENADRFIVLGANAKEIFKTSKYSHLTGKMTIKPNFCFTNAKAKNNTANYYIYVGRLSPEKGLQIILDAFSKTDLSLKIIGSGPLEEEVKFQAEKHNNIEFLGMRDRGEVYSLISNATALIFSSIWYETFGMVIIEAFSCGTPVIASSIGEAKNLINDKVNGLLFNAGDSESLLEKIYYFESLSDSDIERYQENALSTYQNNFTPEINLKLLVDIYSEVIDKTAD